MKTKTRFAWKQFLKNLAIIAIPVALQNMLTTTGSMIDTMMIAPLGETTVGAVGLCAQFSSLMFAGYWGFFGGGMLFFSQYWGAQDDDGIDHSYGLTLTCMMIVGLTFGAFAIFAPETVMKLYTDKESIQVIGAEYLRIIGFGYPVQVFSMAMSALLRSTERVRIPLFASIASVASNIFLNWVFIYGKFGLPEMGVRGAALATSLAAVINVLVILILARAQKYPYLFHFKKHFRWNKKQVKIYFVKCFPIICNEVLIGVGNMGSAHGTNIVGGRCPDFELRAVADVNCGHRGVPHAGGHGHQLLCRFLKCGFRFGRHMRGLRRVGRSLRARKTPCVPVRQHDFVRMSGAARYPQAAAFRDESFRRIDGDRFAHADDLLRGGGYSHV